MNEESAISIFRKLPETKEQITSYSRLIRQSVLDGDVDPLLFASQLSALELMIKTLKDDILVKDVILEAAEKYGQKSFTANNATYQIKEVGTSYDFTVCLDVDWELAQCEEQTAKDKRQAREAILKSLTPTSEIYSSEGIQLQMPKKTSKTQVVITLNK